MSSAELRTRFLWPLVALLAVVAYVYSVDGLYIPHIGDEAPYIEITRLTAESGTWLPLRTAPGLENTKPPALFWLGIVTTRWAESFTLFRLRFPIVVCTFLTAGLTFVVARRLTRDLECGYIAGLTFLGFYSSYQYGRPFLTNLPETLFVFLAFALVLSGVGAEHRERHWLWALVGLSLGVACLFKSFALVAPVGLALAWSALVARRFQWPAFLRFDVPRILLAAGTALACFAMWPALDPEPAEIFRHFVLEENVGKLGGDDYWRGLFTGPYPLHRLWLGHLANAGLFALPLVYLLVVSVRDRARMSVDEKNLWVLVLSFLVVYSVPGQRQENYLLPSVPALAVLIAMRWRHVGSRWFHLFNLPAIAVLAFLIPLLTSMGNDVLPPGSYAGWQLALPVLVLAGWVALTVRPSMARYGFHALVFATFLAISGALAPFEGPLGRFELKRVEALAGRRVFVPESFIRRHERHRFLLPRARIEGYDPLNTEATASLLESGGIVVVHKDVGDSGTGPFRVMARRLDLRSRHTGEEMWRIAFHHELDLLVREELVVRRFRQEREQKQ